MSESEFQGPPGPPEKKKGSLGGAKKIALVVIVLVVGYIIMRQMGIKMVQTSETTELTNNPQHQPDWDEFKERKDKQLTEKRLRDKKAESRLNMFVEDYRKTGNRDLNQTDIRFLEKLDEKAEREGGVFDNARQYFNFMKKSFEFYQAMEDFGNTAPDKKKEADGYIEKFLDVDQEKIIIFTDEEENPDPDDWKDFIDEE